MWSIKKQEIAIDLLKNKIVALERMMEDRRNDIRELSVHLESMDSQLKSSDSSKLLGRLEDLELWRGKIHNLLVEKSPATSKERLTPYGRMFRGKV